MTITEAERAAAIREDLKRPEPRLERCIERGEDGQVRAVWRVLRG